MNEYFDYEYLNQYNGLRSPAGTVENTYIVRYFMRSLYQRALSVIDFTLPESWNVQYFKNVLFRNGFIGVINTSKYGVIPQVCTLTGYGIWMQPTNILVSQPLVRFDGEIGKNCELIKLTPDYFGIWDVVEHYAKMLAQDWTALNMAIENSKISKIAGAKNKAAAETLKVIAEKISSGEPVVVYDKKLQTDGMSGDDLPIWSLSFDNKDFHVNEILESITTILNMYDREIGIPTLNDKKERYISTEVETMVTDSCARIHTWEECLRESIDKTNALFSGQIEPIRFETMAQRQKREIDTEVDNNVSNSED